MWQSISPSSYIGWGKSTQLGYGLGLAMGAKMAAPEKQIINVMGDAAFGMSGLDIETASRSEIPILTVVLNNGVMTHYYDHFPYATEHWGTNKLGGEYANVAQGLGAYGERVSSPDDIAPAIQRALAADEHVRGGIRAYPGLRILRQEPWEAYSRMAYCSSTMVDRSYRDCRF